MRRSRPMLLVAAGLIAGLTPLASSTSSTDFLLATPQCYDVTAGALGIDQGVRVCPPVGPVGD